MQPARPSRTALRVAMRRAAHQLYDPPPLVLDDPIAVPILGEAYLAEVHRTATKLDKPFSVALRAFLVARSRYAEDNLRLAVERGITQYVLSAPASTPSPTATLTPTSASSRSTTPPPSSGSANSSPPATSLTHPASPTHPSTSSANHSPSNSTPRASTHASPPSLPGLESSLPHPPCLPRHHPLHRRAAHRHRPRPRLRPTPLRPTLPRATSRDSLAARVQLAGEPFQLFFTPQEIATELTSNSAAFHTIEDLGSPQINVRYFAHRTDHLKARGSSGRLLSAWH